MIDCLTDNQISVLKKKFIPLIAHRGPDGMKIEIHDDQLWAFYRLAIINPRPNGMQPFKSSQGSRLICNGEIYNYKDILENREVRSDCEAIITLLEASQNTLEQVKQLDGDFAFVWVHGVRTVIARDHVGVAPLFYGVDNKNNLRAVASEAKALIGAPDIIKVHVFPPGHVWENGVFKCYSQCKLTTVGGISNNEAIEKVFKLVSKAVNKRIFHSDRPVGILCSGGIDSSIVAALVAALNNKNKIHVFTMAYEGARSEDAFYASLLCDKLGLKHTIYTFKRNDVKNILPDVIRVCETYDPNTIRAAIPMFLLAKQIAKDTNVRVILSGEGADELFHGYNYFRKAPSGEDAKKEAARLVKNIHMFDLLRAERCFAASGLEVRVPFLDQDLVTFVQSLKGDIPWGGKSNSIEKKLLRDAFANIDVLNEVRILERPKERFSDGCGFSYVPQLLSDISGDLPNLDDRLKAEKVFIQNIYDKIYPDHRHLIISRTMPKWANLNKTKDLLAYE